MPQRAKSKKANRNKFYYCVGCGAEGDLGITKHKRPYWRCVFCGLTIFTRTDASVIGFEVMQSILRQNPQEYREAVMRQLAVNRRKKQREEREAALKAKKSMP